jgi:AcrR family transcriptional regulator
MMAPTRVPHGIGAIVVVILPRLRVPVYRRYIRVPMVYRDTRQALIDAAADVIARRGVEAASTREIYAVAGVKAPTLYHHFGDKQGLLDAVVTDAFERYLAAKRALPPTDGDAAAAIRQGWDLHVSFALSNPALYRLMWPPGQADLPAAAAQSARELQAGFARLAERGALRPGVTPRHAARALSAALSGVTAAITRDPADPGNDVLSATVRDAVIGALVARSADQADRASQPEEQLCAR